MHTRFSNTDLLARAVKLARTERKITLEILNLINEVYTRRAYVEAGFSNCHAWLTKGLGYSESAASRRFRSAEMLRKVPEVANKIEEGVVNLSTLSKTQSVIRAEEKRTGEKFTAEDRREVLLKIESCSQKETEMKLAELFPEALPKQDFVRPIDGSHARVQITVSNELLQKIERLQEVLSHAKPGATIADILEVSVETLLKLKDPLRKEIKPRVVKTDVTSAAAKTDRVVTRSSLKPSVRNLVFRKAGGECEYVDVKTGVRCGSKHFLEIDHRQPRALGGSNDLTNLRLYCQAHNIAAAERIFGQKHMDRFRSFT